MNIVSTLLTRFKAILGIGMPRYLKAAAEEYQMEGRKESVSIDKIGKRGVEVIVVYDAFDYDEERMVSELKKGRDMGITIIGKTAEDVDTAFRNMKQVMEVSWTSPTGPAAGKLGGLFKRSVLIPEREFET